MMTLPLLQPVACSFPAVRLTLGGSIAPESVPGGPTPPGFNFGRAAAHTSAAADAGFGMPGSPVGGGGGLGGPDGGLRSPRSPSGGPGSPGFSHGGGGGGGGGGGADVIGFGTTPVLPFHAPAGK